MLEVGQKEKNHCFNSRRNSENEGNNRKKYKGTTSSVLVNLHHPIILYSCNLRGWRELDMVISEAI